MTNKLLNNILLTSTCAIIASIGTCFMVKADIGISCTDALILTLSKMTKIQMGTMTIVFYSVGIIIQIIIQKKKFKIRQFLQLPVTLLIGLVINFILSHIGNIKLEAYIFKLVFFVLGIILASISIALLLALNLVKFPLEGAHIIISETFKLKFGVVRWSFDIVFALISVILYLFFGQKLEIREGTIINMILLSPLLHFLYSFFRKKDFVKKLRYE